MGGALSGLPPLVEAHTALEKEGLKPPAIGMFFDTSILQWNGSNADGSNYHVDLTTEFGRQWFYAAIRDFFSLIPSAKWARVEGRPIIFLYEAAFAKKQDPQRQFEYVKARFKEDFGVEPFLVKSAGWKGEADAVYSWGGAVSGPILFRDVAALGPGYDHQAVPGRQPLVIDRKDGGTYIERWTKVLQLDPKARPWMVHVETWNEWHEGTDVAHSREYGRSYIVLTRLFADLWHAGTHLDLPSGYVNARSVSWEPEKAEGPGPAAQRRRRELGAARIRRRAGGRHVAESALGGDALPVLQCGRCLCLWPTGQAGCAPDHVPGCRLLVAGCRVRQHGE